MKKQLLALATLSIMLSATPVKANWKEKIQEATVNAGLFVQDNWTNLSLVGLNAAYYNTKGFVDAKHKVVKSQRGYNRHLELAVPALTLFISLGIPGLKFDKKTLISKDSLAEAPIYKGFAELYGIKQTEDPGKTFFKQTGTILGTAGSAYSIYRHFKPYKPRA